MRKIIITPTVTNETEESLRITASKLVRYEPARNGAATSIVYTDELDKMQTALVCESPMEVARLVWAALKPGPVDTRPTVRKVG